MPCEGLLLYPSSGEQEPKRLALVWLHREWERGRLVTLLPRQGN